MYQSHSYNSNDVISIARNLSPKKVGSYQDRTGNSKSKGCRNKTCKTKVNLRL